MQKSKQSGFPPFYDGVFGLMLLGVLLYLAALPPLEFWGLAWLVAACWTPLIRRKTLLSAQWIPDPPVETQKTKRKRSFFRGRPYRQIWLAGVIFWGVAVHWVCFPHWATCFGWFALCCYLGIYFPLFVVFARLLHHTSVFGKRLFPVWLAAPIAYLAATYLQKTLMGGFGFALLEHTQMRQISLIQIADIGGESLVGAVMIFVGVLFGYCLPVHMPRNGSQNENRYPFSAKRRICCVVCTVATFTLLICYAKFRDSQCQPSDRPPLNVALLQGNYKASLSAPAEWYDKVFENYTRMAIEAAHDDERETDLIIWPESTCTYSWVDVDLSETVTPEFADMVQQNKNEILSKKNQTLLQISQHLGTPCIYGTPSYVFSEKNDDYFSYNSALLIENVDSLSYDSDQRERIRVTDFSRYDKMLLVMFGEYLPLTEYLPERFFLKTLCQRADFGKQPVGFVLHKKIGDGDDRAIDDPAKTVDYVASANICFESSSSRVLRQQVLQLKKQGQKPDFLINISNDGWFRHSSQIDMHLATHVFRAIENRMPYLAATNGGFSAGIDGSGNILGIGQRNHN